MSDPLAAYLHDHLAGSNFAIELLKDLQHQHANEPLAAFATALLIELEQRRQLLRQIIDRVGSETAPLKEATTWVGEKLSRFKLSRANSGDAGTFEALELLTLGIHGQIALWRALSVISSTDPRVRGENYDALAAGAQKLHDSVEERRLQLAATAFQAAQE